MLLSTILEAVSYVPGLAAIAAAVAVIGAAIGIGRIGQSQSGMIIAGALVEGATLFAIVVCVLAVLG